MAMTTSQRRLRYLAATIALVLVAAATVLLTVASWFHGRFHVDGGPAGDYGFLVQNARLLQLLQRLGVKDG